MSCRLSAAAERRADAAADAAIYAAAAIAELTPPSRACQPRAAAAMPRRYAAAERV